MGLDIGPRTRAISLNSPSNPIGWTASREELVAVRDACRKHGLWILGDEVYSRFYYGERGAVRAPSFLDVCEEEEMLLLANTFSKNWAMTGWRLGWVIAPAWVNLHLRKLNQYNTSGAATFVSLPKLSDTLERAPAGTPVRLDVSGLRTVDHTCSELIKDWFQRRRAAGDSVELLGGRGKTAALAH